MVMRQEKKPMKISYIVVAPVLALLFLLQGCATSTKGGKIEQGLEASENIAASDQNEAKPIEHTDVADKPEDEAQDDPYEGFNRAMYTFNEKVDNYVAEPIAKAYKWITPNFVQTGISNFFNNTKNVNVVLNDVLQGKLTQSAQDTGRLLVNTTVGLGGLFDVATHVGLEQHDEDFDQTLATWGVPKGAYLVLPIIGPSTARGIPGSVVDTAANPVTYVGLPVQVLSMLNARANAEGALKFIDEAALDPYVFTRESFLQWRDFLASDGKSKAATAGDEFEEELDKIDMEEGTDDKSTAAGNTVSPNTTEKRHDDDVNDISGVSPPSAVVAVQSDKKSPEPKIIKPAVLQTQENPQTTAVTDNSNERSDSGISKPW